MQLGPKQGARPTNAGSPTGAGRGAVCKLYQERLKHPECRRFRGSAAACGAISCKRHGGCAGGLSGAVQVYVLVDEYQDTNVAQYLFLRLLAAEHRNICCVGDDDQSIYGWRGAEVGNILRFEKDFPGAAVIRLEQNYRSTPHILAAASGRDRRQFQPAWARRSGPRPMSGEKVRLIGHWDGEEEARWIAEEIEAHQRGTRGHDPDQPGPSGDPGPRLLPDARLRGPVPDHRPALPRHRRAAVLRADGDPRRHGLFPGLRVAR